MRPACGASMDANFQSLLLFFGVLGTCDCGVCKSRLGITAHVPSYADCVGARLCFNSVECSAHSRMEDGSAACVARLPSCKLARCRLSY